MIEARPETIFPFFTDPDLYSQWGGVATLDPRPGGIFRSAVNAAHVARGEFVTVEPPHRVVFTWGWEAEGSAVPPGTSTVEVTLTPEGEHTTLRLIHRDLPTREEAAAPHRRLGSLPRAPADPRCRRGSGTRPLGAGDERSRRLGRASRASATRGSLDAGYGGKNTLTPKTKETQMATYLLAYRGGGMAETDEEREKAMAAWGAWFGGLGPAIVDAGNPFGASASVGNGGGAAPRP